MVMNKKEILNFLTEMSRSQGFYGRVLRDLTIEQLDYLEKQNFKEPLDLVLFLEC
jgi:hypothetical protein